MKNKIAALIVMLLSSSILHAHESERIEKLEQEVAELKLLILAASLQAASEIDEIEVPKTEKWQEIENWRRLKTDMEPASVEELLGEPKRIDGGRLTTWYYDATSYVKFYEGKVDRWSEPR